MLLTIPWARHLQFRLWWGAAEILYKPYGLPLYGLFWKRTFKIVWNADVVFDSCGHQSYYCGCW